MLHITSHVCVNIGLLLTNPLTTTLMSHCCMPSRRYKCATQFHLWSHLNKTKIREEIALLIILRIDHVFNENRWLMPVLPNVRALLGQPLHIYMVMRCSKSINRNLKMISQGFKPSNDSQVKRCLLQNIEGLKELPCFHKICIIGENDIALFSIQSNMMFL